MPTYQYKCRECDHRFDVSQRITADPLKECPECDGEIRRVLFPTGVVFKGSGWYVTDYRDSAEKKRYEADSKGDAAPSPSSAEAPKADAKPKTDAKPEVKPAEPKPQAAPTAQPAEPVKAA